MSPEDKKLIDEILEKTTDRVRQETRKLEQWILDNKYRIMRLVEMRDLFYQHKFANSASWALQENPSWTENGDIGFYLFGYGDRRGQPMFRQTAPDHKKTHNLLATWDIEKFVSDNFNLHCDDEKYLVSARVIRWAEQILSSMEIMLCDFAQKLGIESPVLPSKREELGATGNGGGAKILYGDVAPTSGGSCMLTPSTFPMSSGGSVTISAGSNKSL